MFVKTYIMSIANVYLSKVINLIKVILSFTFIFSCSIVLFSLSPDLNLGFGALVTVVKYSFIELTINSLIEGFFTGVIYMGLTILRPLIFVLIFMLVELYWGGGQKNWSVLLPALWFKVFKIWLMTCFSIGIRYLPNIDISPLIVLSASDLSPLFGKLSNVIMGLLALLVFDFGIWLSHYLAHKIPVLWHFHRVHHSIEDLQVANNYTHPLDTLWEGFIVVVVSTVFNLNYETMLLLAGWRIMHDDFVHQNSPIHLGILRKVLVDNRYHHFHHSRFKKDYNHNFAAHFTLWDRIFGTYYNTDDVLVKTGVDGVTPPRSLKEFLNAKLEGRENDS